MDTLLVVGLLHFMHQGLTVGIVLTVNPKEVEAKRQDTIVLDCQGNTQNVTEYITNRVIWKHVANDGTQHKITTGFFLAAEADITKYDIQHGKSYNSVTNYSFNLTIFSVADDDGGQYICENEDGTDTILSSVEVQFTVLNPVEKVSMALISVTGHLIYSEFPLANSQIYEVKKEDYKVTCAAEGSNPAPQMTLKFNNIAQQVSPNIENYFVGNRSSYRGTVTNVFPLSAGKIDIQTVECSGGIPRKQFPDKYTGIKLKVFSEVSAAVMMKPLGILLFTLLTILLPRISRGL